MNLTIESIEPGQFTDDATGKVDRYLKLYVREIDGKYVKCGTLGNRILQALYGEDTDDWIGKRLLVTIDEWNDKGAMKPYVKIKKPFRKPGGSAPRQSTAGTSAPATVPNDSADGDDLPF